MVGVGIPLLFTLAALVCGDVQFLPRHKGESVDLPCEHPTDTSGVIGLSVKRKWLQRSELLFLYTKEQPYFPSGSNRERVSVSGDPSTRLVNITITQLKGSDTDCYYCEFVVRGPVDTKVSSDKEFFLHVSDVGSALECECPGYALLLYVTSGAVGLLLLFLIGVVVAYRGKTRHHVKPQQHQPPIYEEMVGVRQTSSKITPFQLEETDTSLYSNAKKKENYYESSKVPDNFSEYQP